MRGVYLVAAELCRLGFIVAPTSRGARGSDLLVTNQSSTKTFSVQVKANSVTFSFFLVGAHAKNLRARNHIYVLINMKPKAVEYYILRSNDVADRVKGTKWHAVYCKDILRFKGNWKIFGSSE